MPRVLNFLRMGTSFDPEAVSSMAKALALVCERLGCPNNPTCDREMIAAEIIAIASGGDCDPDRLCAAALEVLRSHGLACGCRLNSEERG